MAAQPPKVTQWSERLVADSPDVFAVKPTVPSAWAYFCGALGYWLPHNLNRSAQHRAGIRALR